MYKCNIYVIKVTNYIATEGKDFISTPLTAIIPAGATTTTVRVPVISDNIVEGDEMFSMSFDETLLPHGIGTVSNSNVIGVLKDSTSKYNYIMVDVCMYDLLLHNIIHRYSSAVHKRPLHWFRRYRICTGSIGTSWWNIQ